MFGIFVVAVAAATASWLVRTQRVSPFTALGRGLKKVSDPLLKPVEARVYRAGGNPVRAGWWLVIGVAVAGVLVISLMTWLVEAGSDLRGVSGGGPRQVVARLVEIAYNVVFIALLARVILSWMGIGRYTKWMRPAYWLTDWLVEPIRRVLPPFGPLDWSPLVAVLALMLLRWVLLLVL
ncbi:MAG TPA: YggT family protein [Gemmatimonadales bacterium]